MKAAAMAATARGGPEVLARCTLELPWPAGPGDVLVRLHAASVNPADAWFRSFGPYIASTGPFVPGHDGAGIVEAVGAEVTGVRPGDRVCFCHGGIGGVPGTYATHAVAPAALVAAIPASLDFHRAAALPLVAITGWESLFDRAALARGESVLIHGGAGGTGHIACQLAVLRGARVAATVGSEDKAGLLATFGVERPILYRREDFVAAVEDFCGGVSVAFDNVGGATLTQTFRAMAPYGRIVTLMGGAGDDDAATAYNRNLTLINEMMLTPMWYGLGAQLARQAAILRDAVALVADGRLRVLVQHVFPLAEVAAAHRCLEAGALTGKIVLDIA